MLQEISGIFLPPEKVEGLEVKMSKENTKVVCTVGHCGTQEPCNHRKPHKHNDECHKPCKVYGNGATCKEEEQ